MGQSKARRQSLFGKQPFCIFCGGANPATTIEHCPPRAMFQNRNWPEGFEFPACLLCNSGSSSEDVLISFLARMDPIGKLGNDDGRLEGLMRNVNSQYPGLFRRMMPSAVEAKRKNREYGLQPVTGQLHQQTGAVKITPEIESAVRVFSKKLAKAVFFLNTNHVFSSDGCLLLNWFTNVDFFRDGTYVIFDTLKDLPGNLPLVVRTGKHLNNQFECKFSSTDDQRSFAMQARFGNSFGLVVFGCNEPGKLEGTLDQLREKAGHRGPLIVLQSPKHS